MPNSIGSCCAASTIVSQFLIHLPKQLVNPSNRCSTRSRENNAKRNHHISAFRRLTVAVTTSCRFGRKCKSSEMKREDSSSQRSSRSKIASSGARLGGGPCWRGTTDKGASCRCLSVEIVSKRSRCAFLLSEVGVSSTSVLCWGACRGVFVWNGLGGIHAEEESIYYVEY